MFSPSHTVVTSLPFVFVVLITSLINGAARERLGRDTSSAIILLETEQKRLLHEHYFTTDRSDFRQWTEATRYHPSATGCVHRNEIYVRHACVEDGLGRRQCNNDGDDNDGDENNTWWHVATRVILSLNLTKKIQRYWMIKI